MNCPYHACILFLLAALMAGCGDNAEHKPTAPGDIHAAVAAAHTQTQAYGSIASRCMADHLAAVERLYDAVIKLNENPNEDTLDAARAAWRNAYIAHLATDWFYLDAATDAAAARSRLNQRPIVPIQIDYVAGQPMTGLINSRDQPLSRQVLFDHQRDTGEVRLGYHAIEFLLWGESNQSDKPGWRTYDDYRPGHPRRERRRDYLLIAMLQLHNDARALARAWEKGQPQNQFTRMIEAEVPHVLDTMTGRVIDVLDQRAAEVAMKPTVIFSETRQSELQAVAVGLRAVYRGNYGLDQNFKPGDEPGLDDLLEKIDPALEQRIGLLLEQCESQAATTPLPPSRATATTYRELAHALREARLSLQIDTAAAE